MLVDKNALNKYLLELAMQEVIEEYGRFGYKIKKESSVGGFRPDLCITKGKEKIYFEFKVGKLSLSKKQDILNLKKAILNNEPSAKFKLISVSPPKKIRVEVQNIEKIMLEYLSKRPPADAYALSSHPNITEVEEVEIEEAVIEPQNLSFKGTFVITTSLDDRAGDVEFMNDVSLVAKFILETDGGLKVKSLNVMIDTSDIKD